LVLSPYLFSVVTHEVTKEIQDEVPWCIMFADDTVLVEDLEEVNNRLDEGSSVKEGIEN